MSLKTVYLKTQWLEFEKKNKEEGQKLEKKISE